MQKLRLMMSSWHFVLDQDCKTKTQGDAKDVGRHIKCLEKKYNEAIMYERKLGYGLP